MFYNRNIWFSKSKIARLQNETSRESKWSGVLKSFNLKNKSLDPYINI